MAEDFAARVREQMNLEPEVAPLSLFEHVYAQQTPQLREQAHMIRAEMEEVQA